jgi:hypothetical protein
LLFRPLSFILTLFILFPFARKENYRMMNAQVSRLQRGVALLIGLAGLIHLVITPQHWAHAPAHGILFVIVGVVELIWPYSPGGVLRPRCMPSA